MRRGGRGWSVVDEGGGECWSTVPEGFLGGYVGRNFFWAPESLRVPPVQVV